MGVLIFGVSSGGSLLYWDEGSESYKGHVEYKVTEGLIIEEIKLSLYDKIEWYAYRPDGKSIYNWGDGIYDYPLCSFELLNSENAHFDTNSNIITADFKAGFNGDDPTEVITRWADMAGVGCTVKVLLLSKNKEIVGNDIVLGTQDGWTGKEYSSTLSGSDAIGTFNTVLGENGLPTSVKIRVATEDFSLKIKKCEIFNGNNESFTFDFDWSDWENSSAMQEFRKITASEYYPFDGFVEFTSVPEESFWEYPTSSYTEQAYIPSGTWEIRKFSVKFTTLTGYTRDSAITLDFLHEDE